MRPVLLIAVLSLYSWQGVTAYAADSIPKTESIVVTASRTPTAELNTVGNITRLSAEKIQLADAVHPYELAVQIPNTWITRGNGQEQLTSIRSPTLTGAGSCGAFLVMEDGIPSRPTGFCNVNQLFELPSTLANSLEVIRGPANALYGSNGLHGTINVLLPEPGQAASTRVSLETGSNDYWQGQFVWDSGQGESAWNAGLILDHDGGYRDDSGYDQGKLFVKNQQETSNGLLTFGLSGSWLNQDTAGFITGENAYKEDNRFRNENPGAYRDAYSLRLSAGWMPDPGPVWAPEYKIYLRNSDMDFRMHFLPGQPREQNNQTSIGGMFLSRRNIWENTLLTIGIDTEITTGHLDQYQKDPTVSDPPGNGWVENPRPSGQQYNYDADSYLLAGYANLQVPITSRWELQAGLRAEFLHYNYDNKMINGNTDANGNDCLDTPFPSIGGGKCLYQRPADRTDNFSNLAPNIGALYRFNASTVGFANAVRGFRAPQATELYRLQKDQTSADINSVKLDSIETGIRHQSERLQLEMVTFYMKKSNFIFRDSDGFNVDDSKSKHYGIEANIDWRITDPMYLSLVGSYTKHKYDFSRDAGLGEIITKGNEIDAAPKALASARLGYEVDFGLAELEWVYSDAYFMDAANTARYDGHDLLNLRLVATPTDNWSVALRITNLTDKKYADRADLFSTTNEYRYFPGHEREAYLQISWKTGGQ
ncbi:MAG: TonB-dependent receptor [Gammaproteobacteria bacterium]|nr:TonB-dependent receptor [Gammaproteobacteria bacterium]